MNPIPFNNMIMNQHLKEMLEALDQGLLLVGPHWNLEYANRHAKSLFGSHTDEDLGALWHSTLKELAVAAFGAIPEDHPGGSGFDFEIPGAEKPKRLRMESYPIGIDQGLGILLIRNREPLEAPEDDLRLVGRYRSLARLYRTMGHDLKAPLNALTINLDLLKTSVTKYSPSDPLIRERQQRYLKVLEEELGRLGRSLQTFLSQAVPPTQEATRPFNLRELLMELIALVAPQARQQQVAVEMQLDQQNITVEGQRDLLKQALLNLAINALEAMPEGGRLTVTLETRMGRAVILYQDTGAGIPPEVLDKIWELHYTTKKTGTGIGLYVARSVIEALGGIISVDSHNGQGTCFSVSLPIISKEAI